MPRLGVRLTAQFKCVYTNARSMGNKQEELEAIIQQNGYDLVTITETWWDNLHDWHAVMDGYRLFRKDRTTIRGSGVALFEREQLECIELCLGADEEGVESLWVRIKGQAYMGDIIVGGTTGNLTRRRRLMRPSTGSCKQTHSHRPWFSWGTSTALTSAGKTTQLGMCNPGGSCRASMITF